MLPPATVIAYHGTRADPARIYREGLLIADPALLFEAVEGLREDLGVPPPPRWAVRWAQARVREREARPCVFLTCNREQARLYSSMGGELVFQLRGLLLWRKYPEKGPPEQVQAIREAIALMSGQARWVVVVEIPFAWLRRDDQNSFLLRLTENRDVAKWSWDICIPRDIPPYMVKAIEPA